MCIYDKASVGQKQGQRQQNNKIQQDFLSGFLRWDMNKKTGKRTQQVHNWTRCFCPEGNVSFSSCWAKGFNLRAAGTMACGDLLQSLINICSGAETDRDNGPYCPELCTADITERGVEEGRVVTLIVSSRTCLQGFLWRHHSLCHGGDGEDGSCWHCYQGVWCVYVCVCLIQRWLQHSTHLCHFLCSHLLLCVLKTVTQ